MSHANLIGKVKEHDKGFDEKKGKDNSRNQYDWVFERPKDVTCDRPDLRRC